MIKLFMIKVTDAIFITDFQLIFFSVTYTVALKYIHVEKKKSIKNFSFWQRIFPKTLSPDPD